MALDHPFFVSTSYLSRNRIMVNQRLRRIKMTKEQFLEELRKDGIIANMISLGLSTRLERLQLSCY